MQKCRGVRGATTIEQNTQDQIFSATQTLLTTMLMQNQIDSQDIASILFTTTADITAAYPAKAARELGMQLVPLLCFQEMQVEGSLPFCIRILIHWNTSQSQDQIQHIYLNQAQQLRPDLSQK